MDVEPGPGADLHDGGPGRQEAGTDRRHEREVEAVAVLGVRWACAAEDEGGLRHAHHAEEVQRQHRDEGGVHRLPEQKPAERCREDLPPGNVWQERTRAWMKREVHKRTSIEKPIWKCSGCQDLPMCRTS